MILLLTCDVSPSLRPAPNWTILGSANPASTSRYFFDLTAPLPLQRFYRVWQTTTASQPPSLDLHIVPAITLTGPIGSIVRLNYINQFDPIDAWAHLATITLTNASQLCFDASSVGQPPRFWRIQP